MDGSTCNSRILLRRITGTLVHWKRETDLLPKNLGDATEMVEAAGDYAIHGHLAREICTSATYGFESRLFMESVSNVIAT